MKGKSSGDGGSDGGGGGGGGERQRQRNTKDAAGETDCRLKVRQASGGGAEKGGRSSPFVLFSSSDGRR